MKIFQKIKAFFVASSWYVVGSNFTNVLNYTNTILIGRLLGPSAVGDIGSFGAYLGIFGIPVSIVGTFVTQYSNVERYALSIVSYIRKYIGAYLILLLVSFAVSWMLRVEIRSLTHLTDIGSALLIPNLILGALIVPLSAVALGKEKFKFSTIVGLLMALIKLLAVPAILVAHFFSSDLAIATLTLAQIFGTFAFYIYLNRNFHSPESPTFVQIVKFAKDRHFIYTLLGSASMILVANIDIILARRIFEPKTAGIYATWSLLSKMVFFTLGPLLTISFVKQAKKANTGSPQLDSSVKILIIFCLLSIIPVYLGYQYIAPILLKILFGAKFDTLYEYLGLSGVFGTLMLLLNHLANTHIARRSMATIWTIVCILGLIIFSYSMSPSLKDFFVATNVTMIVATTGLYSSLYLKKHTISQS